MIMEWAAGILTACAPILVALVGIIPTVIANRKKTGEALEKVQRTLEAHIKEDEDDKARSMRYRILRFYDEMCEHRKHSESHFEDILDDIDKYESYCAKHPEFKNSRGGIAKDYLKDAYREDKAHGRFLTHKQIDAKGA